MERLLDVTLFLASRNVAFSEREPVSLVMFGMAFFVGLLELIAKYDSVMREHLEKVEELRQGGKRLPAHYLAHMALSK